MNAEIVRILENEFPEPWSVGGRISELLDMLAVLKAGESNEAIHQFVREVSETVQGMVTGRVRGLSDDEKANIDRLYQEWNEKATKEGWFFEKDLDEEEWKTLDITGTTQKFVHPPEDD
jgi:hypothetical protein